MREARLYQSSFHCLSSGAPASSSASSLVCLVHLPSFAIGALSAIRWTWMPVRKLPVRRTSTHCTTGGMPITVHASRVLPVAPPSEYAVGEVSERILTAPRRRSRGLAALALTLATHALLARQPPIWSSIAGTS